MPSFAVIVLAAGGSTRLGSPKQLVEFQGETLVRRAARTAVDSGASQVIVVLGAAAEDIRAALDGIAAEIVVNPNWQLGLGRSICVGVESLRQDIQSAVLMLCDMPLITPDLLSDLAALVQDGEPPIAAAEYNCHLGVPCAFHASYFPTLLKLTGDKGARELIRNARNVARITFQACALDVDTPADLERLQAKK